MVLTAMDKDKNITTYEPNFASFTQPFSQLTSGNSESGAWTAECAAGGQTCSRSLQVVQVTPLSLPPRFECQMTYGTSCVQNLIFINQGKSREEGEGGSAICSEVDAGNPKSIFDQNLVPTRWAPGFVNLVPGVAYHSFLVLSAALTQPGAHLLAEPCTRIGRPPLMPRKRRVHSECQ